MSPFAAFRIAPPEARGLRLARGTTLGFLDAEGLELAVVRGMAWVTQENDTRDIVVRPGERFRLDRAGRAFATALLDAEVDLVSPAAPARHATRPSRLRGLLSFFQGALQASAARRDFPAA